MGETRKFDYKLTSYVNWLSEFATVTGCKVKDNSLSFSPGAGRGHSMAFFLEKGLTACVNNYQLEEDYLLTRRPSDTPGILIYLYEVETPVPVEYKVDNVPFELGYKGHFNLSVINAQSSHRLLFYKSTIMRGISIYLENEWILRNISHPVMKVFDYLKEINYMKLFTNAKQQKLMNELVNVPANHPCPDVYMRSRILRILDKVLENIVQHEISESPERINEEDFNNLQRIEAILTTNFDQAFPGIEKLSRLSYMSESKLKKLFKQSFGMGLYEYFQKNRMHWAKEHLASGKYSISEIGIKLGYQNLSNFSTAFRKEFNCLPSELTVR